MKFVTACANLRSHIFNLPLLNEFDIKKIAGNIIPAIASTNSMVAAIEVSFCIFFEIIHNFNK
jgi:ubiquitin-like 1-activating enzyme E1 B